jgi:ribonuclease BN (tRNA processing enzyme)
MTSCSPQNNDINVPPPSFMRPVGRRRVLQTSALVGGLLMMDAAPAAASTRSNQLTTAKLPTYHEKETSLIILGAAGGPDAAFIHSGCAAALWCRGNVYLIDFGAGLGRQFKLAGLPFDRLKAGFVTHLHSDHIAELYSFFSTHYYYLRQPVEVYGPGRASDSGPFTQAVPGLPEVKGAPLLSPEAPTPGTTDTLELLQKAWAYDGNLRMRDEGMPDLLSKDTLPRIAPHDIPAPEGSNYLNFAPPMAPFPVYSDENVQVTATLVNHGPTFPAFGFRFDTPDGSIVFSGDTGPSENLVRLARNADVLVHEVAYAPWLEHYRNAGWSEELVKHMLESHTPDRTLDGTGTLPASEGVGSIARRAGARNLVLNHYIPSFDFDASTGEVLTVPLKALEREPKREFRGPVTAAPDLFRLDLNRRGR